MKQRISMMFIDDDPSAREGAAVRIRSQPGFHLLAASATVEEALRLVRSIKPDLVLLDFRWEDGVSLALAGALHGEFPGSRVVIMGRHPLHEDVAGFVRAGVAGFIMADASFDTVLGTIHLVARGLRVLPPELTGSLFGQLTGRAVPGPANMTREAARLSDRDRGVTDLLLRGLSNRAIATRLAITRHTVGSRAHKALLKLAVDRRLEVASVSWPRSLGPDPIPLV
ncbi:MAG TPA: response regulator transcription factor [Gemmatimonadales bacterium]